MKIPVLVIFFAAVLGCRAAYEHLGPVEVLDNGVVRLEVALEIGRIVSFQPKDAPDWIVAFDQETIPSWNWHPWGGDRVWPTAQYLNLQIYGNDGFDPVIDGSPWELLSRTDRSLVMRSGISPELGLQITHHIELGVDSADVLHTYEVERVGESAYPVHVWATTGVSEGDYILMESDPVKNHLHRKPYRRWERIYPNKPTATLVPDSRVLQFTWETDDQQKIGTYGNWIAMVRGRQVFYQQIDFDPNELYLELSNLQAYVNRERLTYEIETLSPTWALRKGETREWTVRWSLIDLPKEVQGVESVSAFLNQFSSTPVEE